MECAMPWSLTQHLLKCQLYSSSHPPRKGTQALCRRPDAVIVPTEYILCAHFGILATVSFSGHWVRCLEENCVVACRRILVIIFIYLLEIESCWESLSGLTLRVHDILFHSGFLVLSIG